MSDTGRHNATISPDTPEPRDKTAAEAYESAHVHAVYDAIAPHFSATRHSPWPRVAAYLRRQRDGAVGLDVGCGNGKYLAVNPAVYLVGSDRSAELARLARQRCRGCQVGVADGLALPYRRGVFDFAICVAVVHHLSTRARRVAAVRELLLRLRQTTTTTTTGGEDGGGGERGGDKATALVFVWALEQASSRRGWDRDSAQDTLVPWVMRGDDEAVGEKTFQRYYHLYRQGELEEDIVAAGGVVEESGYERDNWWAVFSRPSG